MIFWSCFGHMVTAWKKYNSTDIIAKGRPKITLTEQHHGWDRNEHFKATVSNR